MAPTEFNQEAIIAKIDHIGEMVGLIRDTIGENSRKHDEEVEKLKLKLEALRLESTTEDGKLREANAKLEGAVGMGKFMIVLVSGIFTALLIWNFSTVNANSKSIVELVGVNKQIDQSFSQMERRIGILEQEEKRVRGVQIQ